MSPPTDPNLHLVTEPGDPEATKALADMLHKERMAKRTDREVLNSIDERQAAIEERLGKVEEGLAGCQRCSGEQMEQLIKVHATLASETARVAKAAFWKPTVLFLLVAGLTGALVAFGIRLAEHLLAR